MKFNYVKPGISFQNVALTTSVSTGCRYKSNHDFGKCYIRITDWDMNIIAENVDGCDIKISDFDFCVGVPTEGSNIIDS